MIKSTLRIINKNSSSRSNIIGIKNNFNSNTNIIKRFNTTLNPINISSSNNSISSATTTTTTNVIINQHNIHQHVSNNLSSIGSFPISNSTSSTAASLLDTLTQQPPPMPSPLPLNNANNNVNNSGSDSDSSNNFNLDTSKLYVSKSTSELFFTFMILKVCSFSFISENSQHFINFFEKLGLSKPLNFFIKYSFFKQFCAGETIRETEIFTEKLNKLGIGSILDYSVEELAGSSEGFDGVADMICETVGIASKNPTNSFSCVKFSGLSPPSLLEKLNQIVSSVTTNIDELPIDAFQNPLEFYLSHSKGKQYELSNKEIQETREFFKRVEKIFNLCNKTSVPILVDAEQSYYQVAIHHICMAFSLKYNKDQPILYNTYQMYLANGMNVLEQHMALSKKLGFKLGAKIVRGAYMITESERSSALGYPNPILPTINDTHNSYNNALDYLLKHLKNDSNSIGIMIASHNEQSINLGTLLVKQYNIDPKNPNIQFGQLFGMADFLSFNLVAQGQRIFKYVPFGPVKEVLPYLIRRMHENKGFIGSNSDKELFYLKKEIKRRLF